MDDDIKWYVQTCHECQVRQMRKVQIPPTVPTVATLFRKAHIDTMHMPKASGYSYIVQACCALTGYPEYKMLRNENAKAIADFIFEQILCRWGALTELVSDNGSAYISAIKTLSDTYHINHIRISAYNSRANGIVEQWHRDVHEAIMKTAEGIESKWPSVVHSVFWAEHITVQKNTGYSPYYMVHGVEPVLPFDITEATYLLPPQNDNVSTAELLVLRGRQLMKREDDLELMRQCVVRLVSSLASDCVNSSNAQASDFATHSLASYSAYSIKAQAPETPDHSLYFAQA